MRPWMFEASKQKPENYCKEVSVTDVRSGSCTIDYRPSDFGDEVWDIASSALNRLGLSLPLPTLSEPLPDL